MCPVNNVPDELIDQVVQDEREAALQEFREREEIDSDTVELADAVRAAVDRRRTTR